MLIHIHIDLGGAPIEYRVEAVLPVDFGAKRDFVVLASSRAFFAANPRKCHAAKVGFGEYFSEFENLRGRFVDATAPADALRRRTKSVPRLDRREMRLGADEFDAVLATPCLDFVDEIVGVAKLHARVAKDDFKRLVRQSACYDIEHDDAVFATAKGDVKDVDARFVFHICVVDVFDRRLFERLESIGAFGDHRFDVDGAQKRLRWLGCVDDFDLWLFIHTCTVDFGDKAAPIPILIRPRPHIGHVVLHLKHPRHIQHGELARIDRTHLDRTIALIGREHDAPRFFVPTIRKHQRSPLNDRASS